MGIIVLLYLVLLNFWAIWATKNAYLLFNHNLKIQPIDNTFGFQIRTTSVLLWVLRAQIIFDSFMIYQHFVVYKQEFTIASF